MGVLRKDVLVTGFGASTTSAVMIMGKRTEPFLRACLSSLSGSVDLLVVNDNGGNPENRRMLDDSELSAQGRVVVLSSEFRGFSYCRNLCLDYLRERIPESAWVLYVDCDEVHPPSLRALSRQILQELPESIGVVDGYFLHFFQSPKYFLSMDRRHNMLFRLYADTRWEGSVHERLIGTRGERLALPYRYFHYGCVTDPVCIADKWRLYGSLGDSVSNRQSENPDVIASGAVDRVLHFGGSHPDVALPMLCGETWMQEFEEMVSVARPNSLPKRLRSLNYDLRIGWRAVQFGVRFGMNGRMRAGLGELLKSP